MHNCKYIKKAVIFAPHPDDAELGMGGTIEKMISKGFQVFVVDLTDGEPTPFGSKEIRAEETKQASKILNIKNRICLNMPNRYLEPTLENRRTLAETIRQFQPDIIFCPCLPDWHPDHVATSQLIEAARFEAKYHKTDMKGQPHWAPHLYYYYSPHRLEYKPPSFIVDISDHWQKKKAAVSAYQSQLKNIKNKQSTGLLERCEITAKFFGLAIGAKFGEPFIANQPITIDL